MAAAQPELVPSEMSVSLAPGKTPEDDSDRERQSGLAGATTDRGVEGSGMDGTSHVKVRG